MTLILSTSKEKKNKVVDALKRRVIETHATSIIMYQTDLKDRIFEVAKAYL